MDYYCYSGHSFTDVHLHWDRLVYRRKLIVVRCSAVPLLRIVLTDIAFIRSSDSLDKFQAVFFKMQEPKKVSVL